MQLLRFLVSVEYHQEMIQVIIMLMTRQTCPSDDYLFPQESNPVNLILFLKRISFAR